MSNWKSEECVELYQWSGAGFRKNECGNNDCKTDVAALVERGGELSNYFERDLLAVIAYIAPAGL